MNTVRFEIGYNDFSNIAKQYPDIRAILISNAGMSLIGYYKNSDEFEQKAEKWISLLDSGCADLDYLPIEETINTLRQIVNGMIKSFGDDCNQRIFLSVQSRNLTYTVDAFVKQGKISFL
ncbi:TPA: hypothetical protein ACQVKY_001112 [Serratia marcescens]|uniref:Uncharacterized protein n=1 Tax=Serratia nevei TaxID=2703794 RepID=A0ABT7G7C1_9GAMM|nr:hypothetical protein [Serratia nevei]HAU4290924.1 hypothetical protein [Serratia marcescens]MDK5169092.1 hypothetical protein [Serratia nevei]MDK5300212.1 hypothetical protein [Serratia nevei]MEC5887162.1 hypothetical protein [Serratia nevei]HAU4299290.1 hypothetical protein [Serratia marcescens]